MFGDVVPKDLYTTSIIYLSTMRLKFQKGKQRELLQRFLLLEGLTTRKFENLYGYYIRNAITEKLTLPKNIFDTLILVRPELNKFKKFIEKELLDNWGPILGGKRSKPPIFKKKIICKECNNNIISVLYLGKTEYLLS